MLMGMVLYKKSMVPRHEAMVSRHEMRPQPLSSLLGTSTDLGRSRWAAYPLPVTSAAAVEQPTAHPRDLGRSRCHHTSYVTYTMYHM